MSFGFAEEPRSADNNLVISNAIAEVLAHKNQHILFFAAAANDGGNQVEMFPARHPSVFAVRATDHHGNFLGLNPPPSVYGQHLFGTLGQDVSAAILSCQQSDSGEMCRTGTSVSTPMVAAIAANILGYAKLRQGSELQSDANKMDSLRTKQGMRLMFVWLAQKMSDKHYYLSADYFNRQNDSTRDAILVAIANRAYEEG